MYTSCVLDKGEPAARWGRKAQGPFPSEGQPGCRRGIIGRELRFFMLGLATGEMQRRTWCVSKS
jgi:hypothetical protein